MTGKERVALAAAMHSGTNLTRAGLVATALAVAALAMLRAVLASMPKLPWMRAPNKAQNVLHML
eukprot:5808234-Alexandrium_andersonii.AAC.1